MSIAVTGVDVLSAYGDGVAPFSAALREGRRAPPRIEGFEASRYATVRGMRLYNRTTQLGICAALRALAAAGFSSTPSGGSGDEDLGVVTASTFGHLDTLLAFDGALLQHGLSRTNPALMPLAICSAPGAATALALGAKAFAITLSDGAASGLDALGLASRLLASGRARRCVVLSAFSPSPELVDAAADAGELAGDDDVRPFEAGSRGTAFGEAAAALVLERAADAGSRAVALVCGHASCFAPDDDERTGDDAARALAAACRKALAGAGVDVPGGGRERLALVATSANGTARADRAAAQALVELGAAAAGAAVTAPQASTGALLDAGGLVQAVSALVALEDGVAPPLARPPGAPFEPAVPGLRYAVKPLRLDGDAALLTSTSRAGACSAVVLARTGRPGRAEVA